MVRVKKLILYMHIHAYVCVYNLSVKMLKKKKKRLFTASHENTWFLLPANSETFFGGGRARTWQLVLAAPRSDLFAPCDITEALH